MRMVTKHRPSIENVQVGSWPLLIHKGSKVVLFEFQGRRPTVWIEQDDNSVAGTCVLHLIATGQEVTDDSLRHLGSAQTSDEEFVYHLYGQGDIERA